MFTAETQPFSKAWLEPCQLYAMKIFCENSYHLKDVDYLCKKGLSTSFC